MDRLTRTQASGGREDCWSESATSTLITAWGERYVRVKRGNLRQKDWKDVAVVVNSSHNGGGKPFKTDVQCKNRIDTLKKKYKVEKSKPSPSTWPFYDRLHSLLGASTSNAAAVTPKTEPPILTLKGGSTASPIECDGDDGNCNGDRVRRHAAEGTELSGGAACRELARAILKFGEIYERIEKSKQEQMVEMEKQRMEFTKELELQRLNMLMEAQVELEKMKRPKYSSPTPASGKKL